MYINKYGNTNEFHFKILCNLETKRRRISIRIPSGQDKKFGYCYFRGIEARGG